MQPDENSCTLINSNVYRLCLLWWKLGYKQDCFPSDWLFDHMCYVYQSWQNSKLNCLLFFDQLYKLYMMKKGHLGVSVFHPLLLLILRTSHQGTQQRGGAVRRSCSIKTWQLILLKEEINSLLLAERAALCHTLFWCFFLWSHVIE